MPLVFMAIKAMKRRAKKASARDPLDHHLLSRDFYVIWGSSFCWLTLHSALHLPARSRAGLESPLLAIRPAAGFAAGASSGSRTGATVNMLRARVPGPEPGFPPSGARMDCGGCPVIIGDDPGVPEKVGQW